jgi:hypothetical protein
LPEDEELDLRVIGVANTQAGRVSRWQVAPDTSDLRTEFGIADAL